MHSALTQWGYLEVFNPPKKTRRHKLFTDERIIAIYKDKGQMTVEAAADKHEVSRSTVQRTWNKTIHTELLRSVDLELVK